MATNYVYHDVSGYCEKDGCNHTFSVKYAEMYFSGNPHPQYKALDVECGQFRLCPHNRNCDIHKNALNSILIE